MMRGRDLALGAVAGALAWLPASHAAKDGIAAGFLSLLAVIVLINVAEWVIYGRE